MENMKIPDWIFKDSTSKPTAFNNAKFNNHMKKEKLPSKHDFVPHGQDVIVLMMVT